MIPVARPWFGTEEEAAVAEVLRSGWVAQGPTCARFEDEFAAAVGVPHAVSVSSCTTGLHLAVVATDNSRSSGQPKVVWWLRRMRKA